ncbi:hypothetical protein RJ639_033927 [Escallonia herrerae]|uniref:Reverse transcriptase Ty1/copia-type domain-containing protein n=1 Tax=Escallonia herrerae TaxID=1293975 RepID=A0AA89BAX7_9ASTE|nr:hypothetical protein RJ639_033927 [Escallonia herrerae]
MQHDLHLQQEVALQAHRGQAYLTMSIMTEQNRYLAHQIFDQAHGFTIFSCLDTPAPKGKNGSSTHISRTTLRCHALHVSLKLSKYAQLLRRLLIPPPPLKVLVNLLRRLLVLPPLHMVLVTAGLDYKGDQHNNNHQHRHRNKNNRRAPPRAKHNVVEADDYVIATVISEVNLITEIDVKNAFLNSDLIEEVYMQPPPRYSHPPNKVFRLRCGIYGLKQAPHSWISKFNSILKQFGFVSGAYDSALFIRKSAQGIILVPLYVDDMIITCSDLDSISILKQDLNHHIEMKDLGTLSYFLGLEVSSASDGYYLSQAKYASDLFSRADLTDSKTASTSLEPNIRGHRGIHNDPLEERNICINAEPRVSSSCDMNFESRLLYSLLPRSLSKYDIINPFFLAIFDRMKPERFIGAPVTTKAVLSFAKLDKATNVSGSLAEEASTKKIWLKCPAKVVPQRDKEMALEGLKSDEEQRLALYQAKSFRARLCKQEQEKERGVLHPIEHLINFRVSKLAALHGMGEEVLHKPLSYDVHKVHVIYWTSLVSNKRGSRGDEGVPNEEETGLEDDRGGTEKDGEGFEED